MKTIVKKYLTAARVLLSQAKTGVTLLFVLLLTTVCSGQSVSRSVSYSCPGGINEFNYNPPLPGQCDGCTFVRWVATGSPTIHHQDANYTELSWSVGGNYTVKADYFKPGWGTVSTEVVQVTIENVTPTITGGPVSVCTGTTGHVYTTQTGKSNYQWTVSPGGTITSGQGTSQLTVTWNQAGARSVTVTYTSSGCGGSPAQRNVTVHARPVPTLSITEGNACVNAGQRFATQSGKTNYQWSVSSGGSGGSASSTNYVTWSAGGAQSVSVNYTDPATNCSATSPTVLPVTITNLPAPIIQDPLVNGSGFTARWTNTGATQYQLYLTDNPASPYYVPGGSATTLTTAVSGLQQYTTYYYKIKSTCSSNEAEGSVRIDPTMPYTGMATEVTDRSFAANYGMYDAPTYRTYHLQVSTNSAYAPLVHETTITGNGGSYTVNGLSPNTSYWWRVRYQHADGTWSLYSPVTQGREQTTEGPPPPAQISVASVTTTGFTLTCPPVNKATSYRLYVAYDGDLFNLLPGYAGVEISNINNISVTGLEPGRLYYYMVRTSNQWGSTNVFNPAAVVTTPVLASHAELTANTFRVNWLAATGATAYYLDVSSESSFTNPAAFVSGFNNRQVSGVTELVTGLSGNTTYYYRIRVAQGATISNSSAHQSVLTFPSAPVIRVGPVALTGFLIYSDDMGEVTWRLDIAYVHANGELESYVDGYHDLAISSIPWLGAEEMVFDITGLEEATTYYCRMRVENATGTSANSTVLTVTTQTPPPQLSNKNVIVKRVPWQATPYEFDLDGDFPSQTSITYYDGLGRPEQQVNWKASPAQLDVIRPIAYDEFGREPVKYLPYAASDQTGSFRTTAINDQAGFYSWKFSDNKGYSKTVFENSPLNRTVKQGAPGTPWQPNAVNSYSSTDHTVKFSYETNNASDVILWAYEPDAGGGSGSVIYDGHYAANELHRTRSKDEQGNEVIEFKDKQGRVVVKKVQAPGNTWAETYYHYDNHGNLVLVLPPESVKALKTMAGLN